MGDGHEQQVQAAWAAQIANAAAGVRKQLEHQLAGNWCRGGGTVSRLWSGQTVLLDNSWSGRVKREAGMCGSRWYTRLAVRTSTTPVYFYPSVPFPGLL
jgi:hypothetical protein